MRLVCYARISREKEGEDLSITAQQQRCVYWARARGDEVVSFFSEVKSGRKERPGLEQAIAEIEAGRADGLVVYKLDRLGRRAKQLLELIERFHRNGWVLSTVSETLDTRTAMGRFCVQMICSIAELEAAQISERTQDGLRSKAPHGGYHASPYVRFGWRFRNGRFRRRKGDPTETVPHPGEQRALRRIRELIRNGEGPDGRPMNSQAIRRTLIQEGIPNPRRARGRWHVSDVQEIIRAERREQKWLIRTRQDRRDEVDRSAPPLPAA